MPRRTQAPSREGFIISRTGISPSLSGFPKPFRYDKTFSLHRVLTRGRPYNPALMGGLGFSGFARRYFRNHVCLATLLFSVPGVLRWFSPPGFASAAYIFSGRMTGSSPAGLPHSAIRGSQDVCSYPRLFAAYHGLLRLLTPRHSP